MKRISQQRLEKLIEGKVKLIPLIIAVLITVFFLAKLLYDLTLN